MALQSSLSRLPHKGLLRSFSYGVGKVNTSDSGSWTSLQKLPPLLPCRMSHVSDFKNIHSFAAVNYSLQPGNHPQRYQCGGARDLLLRTDNSQRHYLHGGAGTPPESYTHFILRGDDLLRVESRMIANHVRGCLVCLALSQDGKIFAELSGTIIRSDGIIATSASCLSSLKSKELKVTVDVRIPDTGETCKGVLLDADFDSNIAFVKIRSCKKPPVPAIGKFNFLRFRTFVVAAGCSFSHMGCELAEPRYVACYRSLPTSVIENTESRNASTSGQIVEVVANKSEAADIGGCLVDPLQGVVGIVHSVRDSEVKGTPIDIVFKTLEDIKMNSMRSIRQKKDPEHAHKHKVKEEIAITVAVGAAGYAFHEHHEKKESKHHHHHH